MRPRKWYVSFCHRGVVDRCCLFVLAFKKSSSQADTIYEIFVDLELRLSKPWHQKSLLKHPFLWCPKVFTDPISFFRGMGFQLHGVPVCPGMAFVARKQFRRFFLDICWWISKKYGCPTRANNLSPLRKALESQFWAPKPRGRLLKQLQVPRGSSRGLKMVTSCCSLGYPNWWPKYAGERFKKTPQIM